jgi:hypothetical protein
VLSLRGNKTILSGLKMSDRQAKNIVSDNLDEKRQMQLKMTAK